MTYQEFYSLYSKATSTEEFELFVNCKEHQLLEEYPKIQVMDILKSIWELHTNPIKAIKKATGFTSQDISKQYNISVRAIDEWARGGRTPPEYVITMLAYCIYTDVEII